MDAETPTPPGAPGDTGGFAAMTREVDVEHRRIVLTLHGPVGMRAWAAHVRHMVAHQDRELAFDRLVDGSAMVGEWSSTEIRGIAEDLAYAFSNVTSRVAVVAPTDPSADMWNSFFRVIGRAAARVRLFRSRGDAEAWLAGTTPNGQG